ncbi:UNVERIFIED_CONTAM: hypothetical protein HDU68_003016 [Siphonaria sp. JEL0065]|nr:hypothetical protein HDU68_003016 [Siphonaria sp. JEL0065]
MKLEHLPTEVLLQITSFLPLDTRISLLHVSHRFKQIATDPSLWSKIVLIRDFSRSNEYISQLYQRERLVVETKITGGPAQGKDGRLSGQPGKKNVNSMSEIIGCLLGTVIPIAGPVGIRELNVRGLAEQFTDSHLMQIARWCPRLVSCTVSGTSVTDQGVQYLFGSVTSYQKSIEALRDGVSRSRHTSTAPSKAHDVTTSIASFPPPAPPPPAPPVQQESSEDLDVTIQEYIVNDRCNSDSFHSNKQHNFTGSGYEQREKQIVEDITKGLSLLLPTAFMNNLNQKEKSLEPFCAPTSSPTAVSTTKTSPRCPNIQHLFLSGSKPITDKTVARIAFNSIHLKTLDLTSFTSSSRVSDSGIMLVSKHCLGLETLMISGCSQITDESLMSFGGWEKTDIVKGNVKDLWKAREPFKSKLKRLELSGCFQVTDFGASAILIGCTELEVLDLGYCWRITDAAFYQSEESFMLDRRLAFWKDYTDKICCLGLRVLSVRFCYLVTDVGVSQFLREDYGKGEYVFKELSKVDVTSCQRVTRRSDNVILYWDEADEFERDLQG